MINCLVSVKLIVHNLLLQYLMIRSLRHLIEVNVVLVCFRIFKKYLMQSIMKYSLECYSTMVLEDSYSTMVLEESYSTMVLEESYSTMVLKEHH